VGDTLAKTLDLPVWFYAEASDPPGRGLAEIRRGGFEALLQGIPPERHPDCYPGMATGAEAVMHPSAGGVAVGARPVLLAWNVDVEGVEMDRLRALASRLREAGGGIPGLRVLALELATQGRRQLSMNLEDATRRDPFGVFQRLEQAVAAEGGEITATEIIGIPPDNLFREAAAHRLRLVGSPGRDALAPQLLRHLAKDGRP
jgi:glutamate formiminotransferase